MGEQNASTHIIRWFRVGDWCGRSAHTLCANGFVRSDKNGISFSDYRRISCVKEKIFDYKYHLLRICNEET